MNCAACSNLMFMRYESFDVDGGGSMGVGGMLCKCRAFDVVVAPMGGTNYVLSGVNGRIKECNQYSAICEGTVAVEGDSITQSSDVG